MKYSPEQTKYHIDTIYGIVSKNPDMSTRTLCYHLNEKGIKLNRAYATKLMWKAYDRMTQEEESLRKKRPQFEQWKTRLGEFGKELNDLRFKLTEIIADYPGDWIDPHNRHDYDY